VTDLYIEGVALDITWGDSSRNLTDLIFDTVRSAVDDSGQPMEAIDSVVLAAHDLVDGRSLTSMVTAPAAGAYLKDEIRFGDDSAGAFAAAMTRLEAGHNERTIVAAWGRASEHDVDGFSHSLFDPFYGRPVGLDELAVSALRAQRWLQRYDDADRPRAVERRLRQAGQNPRALRSGGLKQSAPYPIKAEELPTWADVSVALVMSTQPTGIKVAGMGQSSDPYQIGDRDLLAMPALASAVDRALADASTSAADLDLVELDALTGIDDALCVEAIGFSEPGGGFQYVADDPRFNPSGGSAAGFCPPAMGLFRLVEACLQLRGTAGAIQLPDVRRALVTGSSLVASQTHTAIVLEAS
jgi:hypothetical protein